MSILSVCVLIFSSCKILELEKPLDLAMIEQSFSNVKITVELTSTIDGESQTTVNVIEYDYGKTYLCEIADGVKRFERYVSQEDEINIVYEKKSDEWSIIEVSDENLERYNVSIKPFTGTTKDDFIKKDDYYEISPKKIEEQNATLERLKLEASEGSFGHIDIDVVFMRIEYTKCKIISNKLLEVQQKFMNDKGDERYVNVKFTDYGKIKITLPEIE